MNLGEEKELEEEEEEVVEAEDPEDMAAKLKKQLEDLEAEHKEAIHKGCDEDAEFIYKQMQEVQIFMKEHKIFLKKLVGKKGEDDKFFDEDDLSIDLSDKEDMDVDKANCKRLRNDLN